MAFCLSCSFLLSLLLRSMLASLPSSDRALKVSSLEAPVARCSCSWAFPLLEVLAHGGSSSWRLLLLEVLVPGGSCSASRAGLPWHLVGGLWKTLQGSGTSGGLLAVNSCLSCSCLLFLLLQSMFASLVSSDWALMVSPLEAPVA